jgi:hypothetical protein
MTMCVGAAWRGAGFLAWDTRARWRWSDGTTTYDEDGTVPPCLTSFPLGWAAAGGVYSVARSALDALQDSGGGTLDELGAALAPTMAVACANTPSGGFDPANDRVAILTAASGELEAGSFQPRRGLERYAPGSRFYIPPGDVDREALDARFQAFVRETTDVPSHYTRLRALARFYRDAATMTPHLSGFLRVGLIQRPGDTWEMARLEGVAAELAEAGDTDLSHFMRHEVPQCSGPSPSECSP